MRIGVEPLKNDQWSWVDGTAVNYSNWHTSQPSNYDGMEYCMHLNYGSRGKWNDEQCDEQYNSGYICEKDVKCKFWNPI